MTERNGEDVLADAYAEWDPERQRWEVQDVFLKNGFCASCDGQVSIEGDYIRKN
tara:strand:+ start:2779 stop:2940 length:162 start_codon:yes stop_codon:yes gene_type:complete